MMIILTNGKSNTTLRQDRIFSRNHDILLKCKSVLFGTTSTSTIDDNNDNDDI